MADDNRLTLLCRECGAQFQRENGMGRKPTYCPPCGLNARRRSGREWARKTAVEQRVEPRMSGVCVDCSSSFVRQSKFGRFPDRCPGCGAARMAAITSRRHAFHNAKRSKASREQHERESCWSTCHGCGRLLFREFGKRYRRWCLRCEKARSLQRLRDATASRLPYMIACIDCSMLAPSCFKTRRLRCDACAKKRHRHTARRWVTNNPDRRREQYRRRGHIRRARRAAVESERFNSFDIFVRDRWICGICRKKISPRLRFPHPMSVSLDHIIPFAEGGPHTRANCRATHLGCNSRRQHRGGGEQLALIG